MDDIKTKPTLRDHAKCMRQRFTEKARIWQYSHRASDWPTRRGINAITKTGSRMLVFSEQSYAVESELMLACIAEAAGCICLLAGTPKAEEYWRVMGFSADRFISWQKYERLFHKMATQETEKILTKKYSFQEMREMSFRGVELGRHVLSAAGRKYFRAFFDPRDPLYHEGIRKYLYRGIQKTLIAEAVYNDYGVNQVLLNEPNYDNVGISRIALLHGNSYIQFCQPYEESAFILKRYKAGMQHMNPNSISEDSWKRIRLYSMSSTLDEEIERIVKVKYSDQNLWSRRIGLNSPHLSRDEILRRLELDTSKKTAVIFSHVLWDGNMFWGRDLFDGGAEEWLVETVRMALCNTNLNWIIKVHPANVWKMKAAGIAIEYNDVKAIQNAFGRLPSNFRILLPEDNINPWSLFQIADVGLTIRGTIGMELPMLGVPVVTAGTGRYSGHGFTVNPQSIDEYDKIIQNIQYLEPLTEQEVNLAKRYFWSISGPRAWRSRLFRIPKTMGSHDLFFRLMSWKNISNADKTLMQFFTDIDQEDYLFLEDL